MNREIRLFNQLKDNTKGFLRQKWFSMRTATQVLGLSYFYINATLNALATAGLIQKKGNQKSRLYRCA